MTTNAQLAAQITDLLTRWNAREAQFRDWLGGAVTGGPNGDGKFPLTNAAGDTQNVDSPARLASTVTGPAAVAVAAKDAAEDARDAAASSATTAGSKADDANAHNLSARQWRDEAEVFRNEAAASQGGSSSALAAILAARDLTLAARDVVLPARDETVEAQARALQAAEDALLSRDAAAAYAASINPAMLATKAELASEIDAILGSVPGALDTLAELAAAMGNDPNFATTVTNALADKAALTHTHIPADITGLDTLLAGKAPVSHGHGMADISGLTVALDGKAAAGHGHSVADIGGLVAALAGKAAASSAVIENSLRVQSSTLPALELVRNGIIQWNVGGRGDTEFELWFNATASALKVNTSNVATFAARPVFNEATPWDSANFDPGAKATLGASARFRDLQADREDGTGVVYFGDGSAWLYYSGSGFYFAGAELNVSNGALNVASGSITSGGAAVLSEVAMWNNGGGPHGNRADFNDTNKLGCVYIQGPTNGPGTGSGQFYTQVMGLGANYPQSDYCLQIAYPRFHGDDTYVTMRNREGGSWGGWKKISAGYADNAGAVGTVPAARVLKHGGSRASGTVTISTAAPSGGADGDVWFKV